MQRNAKQHIFITGACGAGKSTLSQALSHQLQLPLHRLDDDPDFRQMLPDEPWLHRVTDPQRYARWQALRRQVVQEAVTLPQPHIIEGTHILTAPAFTSGHRRILGRHALPPDYPTIAGAGSREVCRGPHTVRRS